MTNGHRNKVQNYTKFDSPKTKIKSFWDISMIYFTKKKKEQRIQLNFKSSLNKMKKQINLKGY
jgi:hypothetical protein